jgi:AbrB family looped-hinge helix DNA binding protein
MQGYYLMKVTTKGQVTIPQHIRRFLGISAYSEVDFEIEDAKVVLLKLPDKGGEAFSSSGRFRRLRGLKKGELTTEKWMAATRGE